VSSYLGSLLYAAAHPRWDGDGGGAPAGLQLNKHTFCTHDDIKREAEISY
jgi:hypothetical protein